MPPQLQPGESREAATVRWLTRLLSALVDQSPNGLVRISPVSLATEHNAMDLVESRDKNGDIILRFDSVKDIAIYKLGGAPWMNNPAATETRTSTTYSPGQQTLTSEPSPTPQPTNSAVGVSPPKTQEQLAQMEATLRKQKLANTILAGSLQKERQKRESLEALLETAEVLNPPK